jgi:hypothetical protein
LSAATHAFTASTVQVIFAAPFGSVSTIRLRPASKSVMSARSFCVTIGMVRHATVRFLAIVSRILATGFFSISPYLAKSGSGGRVKAFTTLPLIAPPPDLMVWRSVRTNPFTSSSVTRPPRPEAFTSISATPSSRANRRVAGPAGVRSFLPLVAGA